MICEANVFQFFYIINNNTKTIKKIENVFYKINILQIQK